MRYMPEQQGTGYCTLLGSDYPVCDRYYPGVFPSVNSQMANQNAGKCED